MKSLFVLTSLFTVLAAHAFGSPFTVESTSRSPVLTGVLQLGTTYLFEASGTYQYDVLGRPAYWADAEFMHYAASGIDYGIREQRGLGVTEDILDLVIDGHEVDWLGNDGFGWQAHTFSADHVYRYYVLGAGLPVELLIADWEPLVAQDYRTDNAGSLQVKVSAVTEPVPEPASLLLFGTGLVGLRAWRKRRQ